MLRLKEEYDTYIHLKTWFLFSSIERETLISEKPVLLNLSCLENSPKKVENTKKYIESFEFGISSYLQVTQSKTFCIIYPMFAKDEMSVFPFSPELKLLFQTYLEKLVKKYHCLRRVFPLFQVFITQVEKDPQLQKEVIQHKVSMLRIIKVEIMNELSRLLSEASFLLKQEFIFDFLKVGSKVALEAGKLLASQEKVKDCQYEKGL